MIPLTQLLQPITKDQARATFVTALKGLGIPADQWKPGGVFSTMLTVVAWTYAGFSTAMVQALSSQFLPYASGAWLVLLAYYVYGVTAVPATPASGQVTLVNTGGGIYGPYAPGQFKVSNPATGITYSNVNSLSIAALATVTGVQIIASTPGSIGNATPGAISALVTGALGVTVSNPLSVIGQDAQSDPSVRATCLNKLASLSNRGPRGAYSFAVSQAINLVTGQPVNVNRTSIAVLPGGIINVTIASPSGTPTSDDIAAVVLAVEAVARPSGVTVYVFAATTAPYAAALTIWAQATPGVTPGAIQTAAASALAAFIAQYPIGGLAFSDNQGAHQGLFGSGVSAVVGAAAAQLAPVFSIDFNSSEAPADLALVAGQVATDAATIAVRMVGGP